MKLIPLLLLTSLCEKEFWISRKALDGSHIPFQPKIGIEPYSNYLQMTLDFKYFKPIFARLNSTVGVPPLTTRGEAHVTVISPPEYETVLSRYVDISEINFIAKKLKIQTSRFKISCVGRDAKFIDVKNQIAYNLVLKDTHHLVAIRKVVFNLYKGRGGEGSLFQPEAFWGHITLGFKHRDLFIEDGIFKGENSCWAPVKMTPRCILL
ncbi:hypothetical protein DSO57_1038453 [Entomophthora muscae]|uniref:Uncharacterized protein n=1 Tax=Entomophthora muscae TaxID=34485 RepID=A0ACC2SZ96_9FUNG|nr:hypothetical protein DSO57_1038453 [Entomophthora muscae]